MSDYQNLFLDSQKPYKILDFRISKKQIVVVGQTEMLAFQKEYKHLAIANAGYLFMYIIN